MNHRIFSAAAAALCLAVTLNLNAHAAFEDVPAQPINLIINKPTKAGIPDPDPVVIGEFGSNMIYSAKVNATVRKLFFKPVMRKDKASGIDKPLQPSEIGTKKYPPKVSFAVKGDIDNYVYEEDPTNDSNAVAFFHEKGKGIYRASCTSLGSSKLVFLKTTDTDKTGADPEKMASGLSILDWEGKFPTFNFPANKKNYQFPFLLFAAPDKKRGKELWLSDGTAAGTKFFVDLNTTSTTVPGPKNKPVQVPNGSEISPISTYFGSLAAPTSYGGSAFFSAYNGTGYDVYRVDRVQDAQKKQPRVTVTTLFNRLAGFSLAVKPSQLTATPEGVMFALPTLNSGGSEEVWGYQVEADALTVFSNQAGTIQPSRAEFRDGFQFGSYQGYFFSGNVGGTGQEPQHATFDSSGNGLITTLGNLAAGAASSNPRDFTQVGHSVFFVANPGGGEHLYRSNGTPSGTEDLGAFTNVHEITPVVNFFANGDEQGTRCYFVANNASGTPVLWYAHTIDAIGSDPNLPTGVVQVLTAGGSPIKNPAHLRPLLGNGIYYLFFVCDGVGTEYEMITPAKGSPFPAQRQVWYTGRYNNTN